MNEHIKLAIQAICRMRGDDYERFIAHYGTPERSKRPAEWWDAPGKWGGEQTMRNAFVNLQIDKARYDAAIVYLEGLRG